MPFPACSRPLGALSARCPLPWAGLPLSADNPPVDVFEWHSSSSRRCALLSLSRLLSVSCWRVLGFWHAASAPRAARALTRGESKGGAGLLRRGAGVPRHTTSSRCLSPFCSMGLERVSWGLEDLFCCWALSGSVEAEGHTAAFTSLSLTEDFTFLVWGSLTVLSSLQKADLASCCIDFSFCL